MPTKTNHGGGHMFHCQERDFEGDLAGAVTHCELTGHELKRKINLHGGYTTTVRLLGDDE